VKNVSHGIALGLQKVDILRATDILKKPVTALEFADAFWPDRVHDRRRKRAAPSSRSRAGHAILRGLMSRGIARRNSSGDSKRDTFSVVDAPVVNKPRDGAPESTESLLVEARSAVGILDAPVQRREQFELRDALALRYDAKEQLHKTFRRLDAALSAGAPLPRAWLSRSHGRLAPVAAKSTTSSKGKR
jgi:hypothetical protein